MIMNTVPFLRWIMPGWACFAALAPACAQDDYVFELVQGDTRSYVELTGDTWISDFDLDGFHYLPVMDEQELHLFGSAFLLGGGYGISVSAHGEVRITSNTDLVLVDVAGGGLEPIDENSRVSYQLLGAPGSHRLVVQYRHMRLASGPGTNELNAQIWIDQATGAIELQYGYRSENNASGYTPFTGPQVGILHATAGMTSCLEKSWLTGPPNAPLLNSALDCERPGLTGLPYHGTTYRFMPTFLVPAGIGEEALAAPLELYPVPAHDRLTVRTPLSDARAELRIMDGMGRIVQVIRPTGERTDLDLAGLAPGHYLAVLSTPNGLQRGRFTKE